MNNTSTGELLSARTVVVAGALGQLGRHVVQAILRHGGVAIATDLNDVALVEFQHSINTSSYSGTLLTRPLNIMDEKSLAELFAWLADTGHFVDGFVNCAYPRNKNYGAKLEQVGFSDFTENVSTHLGGYFLAAKEFANHCRSRGIKGSLVNISSIYGVVAPRFEIYDGTEMTMPIEYAAIKAGLIHITKYFSKYFKHSGIRFNCVSPGGILSDQPETFLEGYNKFALSKGMLAAEDVVGGIVFLLSDLSTYINGQNIVVDDGWSL